MEGSPGSVARWTAEELKARLNRGDPMTVLDVREDHERDHAAISLPSAVPNLHISMGEVAASFAEIADACSGRPLVVYCHHGVRSMVAATWLARRGIADVCNLDGGIDAWSKRVDPSVARY